MDRVVNFKKYLEISTFCLLQISFACTILYQMKKVINATKSKSQTKSEKTLSDLEVRINKRSDDRTDFIIEKFDAILEDSKRETLAYIELQTREILDAFKDYTKSINDKQIALEKKVSVIEKIVQKSF